MCADAAPEHLEPPQRPCVGRAEASWGVSCLARQRPGLPTVTWCGRSDPQGVFLDIEHAALHRRTIGHAPGQDPLGPTGGLKPRTTCPRCVLAILEALP